MKDFKHIVPNSLQLIDRYIQQTILNSTSRHTDTHAPVFIQHTLLAVSIGSEFTTENCAGTVCVKFCSVQRHKVTSSHLSNHFNP